MYGTNSFYPSIYSFSPLHIPPSRPRVRIVTDRWRYDSERRGMKVSRGRFQVENGGFLSV